jgi:hypothetical protein
MRIALVASAAVALVAVLATLRAAGQVDDPVAIARGMNTASPARAEDLRFAAVATVGTTHPALIHAKLTIANRTSEWRRVGFGACRGRSSLQLRLHRSPERSDAPVWDSAAANAGTFCKGVGVTAIVAPGASTSSDELALHAQVPATLPAGTYYGSVTLEIFDPRVTVDLPTGALILGKL